MLRFISVCLVLVMLAGCSLFQKDEENQSPQPTSPNLEGTQPL